MKDSWLYLLILMLLPLSSDAQTTSYSILHYTTDNGLPQNSIKSINFDKAGYCWLATELGLVRFDGANFQTFNSNNVPGLKADRIIVVARDAHGNTYAQTETGNQLALVPPKSGRAPFPEVPKQEVCFSWVNNLAIKPSRMVGVINHFIQAPEYGGMNNFCIATSDSEVYVVVRGKVYHVRGTSLEFVTTITDSYFKHLLVIDNKLVLFQPWGKTRIINNGILQRDTLAILGPLDKNKAFRSDDYKIIQSATGTFLGTDKAIYRLRVNNGKIVSELLLKEADMKGIDFSDICSIYYNAEQQKYYIGTVISGLYVVAPAVFKYPQIPDQAIKKGFRSQIAAESGESIICEQYQYHKDGTSRLLPIGGAIGATVYLKDNKVMLYGNTPELYKFDLKTQRVTMLFKLDSRPSGILPDKTDSSFTWICTSLSVGKLYNDTSIVFKKVPDKSSGNRIWGLAQIGEDSLLLTTREGLKWYDWQHNKIYASILDSLIIQSVYAETAERIWISTAGKGIYLHAKGKITAFPDNNIDALKKVHSFVDDGRDGFWLPTNNGLYKVSKQALLAYAEGKLKDVYYYSFTTQNDLRSNEFNGGSIPHYVWFKDSMLSLLSIRGPVWFYPHKVKIQYPDKKIFADKLEIDNQVIPYPDNGHIILPPDFNNITLTVSSPYFGNKENLQLKYKVEGIDNDWQLVDDNGKIKVNRILSGNYRLVVRKLDGHGIDHYDSFVLSLTVKPHFYNTWWFFAILAVMITGGIYLGIKLRTRMLVKRNQKLNDIIAAQTEDLRQTVQQLSISEQELNESNRMKDNIITMVLHDLRSPIRFMGLISNYLASAHGKLPADEMERKLRELKNSTTSLSNFTEQFFTWAISHHKNFKVSKSWFILDDIFNETKTLYGEIVEANDNHLIVEQAKYSCFNDPQILTVIIRNLLDNANKHTSNGVITLSAKQEGDKLIISISDTGIGFSEEALHMFLSKKEYDGSKNGNGSFIVLSLVQLIGGTLEATSEQGVGTKFRIILNLQ